MILKKWMLNSVLGCHYYIQVRLKEKRTSDRDGVGGGGEIAPEQLD